MHHTKATKALCAVLAIALVACPFVATAARVTPQRSLLASNPETVGFIPVFKSAPSSFAPAGCTPGVTCAVGQLIGFIPLLKSTSGLLGLNVVIELGNLISVVSDVVGKPIPDGLTILPAALGKALSVVNVALGPLRPIFGGPVVGGLTGLLTGLLGTVLGLVAVVVGAVVALVDGLLIALLGGAVRIGGILPLTASGGGLGGLLTGLLGSAPLAGIPFLTALSSAGPVPAILEPQVLGALLAEDGSPASQPINTFFPKELSTGGVTGTNIVGVLPIYRSTDGTVCVSANVLGLAQLDVNLKLSPGLQGCIVNVDVNVLGDPIGHIVVVGNHALKA